MIAFTATVWIWNAEKGSWHFVSVPEEQSLEIRAESFVTRGSFGSVMVMAEVRGISWRTSVFPQKGSGYLLPLNADVRRRAQLVEGDELSVTLSLV